MHQKISKSLKICKGNGYVRGSSENTGTCLFCSGSGHKKQGPRVTAEDYMTIIEKVYVDTYGSAKQTKKKSN
jgi:hypothetical protein